MGRSSDCWPCRLGRHSARKALCRETDDRFGGNRYADLAFRHFIVAPALGAALSDVEHWAIHRLGGVGLASLPMPVFVTSVALVATAAGVNVASYYSRETKPRWDLAAMYLAEHAKPNDLIVVNDNAAQYVLTAYGSKYTLNLANVLLSSDLPGRYKNAPQAAGLWAIYGRTGHGQIVSEAAYLDRLPLPGGPSIKLSFGRDVIAYRLEHVIAASAGKQSVPN